MEGSGPTRSPGTAYSRSLRTGTDDLLPTTARSESTPLPVVAESPMNHRDSMTSGRRMRLELAEW